MTRKQLQLLVAGLLLLAIIALAGGLYIAQPERPTRTWGSFNMGDK